MGRPYSTDLRERVLRACEVGEESQAAIARRFEISESAVGSWLRQLRQDGRREPKPHGRGFASILDENDGAVLRSLVAQTATLSAAVEHAVDAHPDGKIVTSLFRKGRVCAATPARRDQGRPCAVRVGHSLPRAAPRL